MATRMGARTFSASRRRRGSALTIPSTTPRNTFRSRRDAKMEYRSSDAQSIGSTIATAMGRAPTARRWWSNAATRVSAAANCARSSLQHLELDVAGLVKRGESRHEVAVAGVIVFYGHCCDDRELALAVKGLAVDVHEGQERCDALRPRSARVGGERPRPCSARCGGERSQRTSRFADGFGGGGGRGEREC